MGKYFYYLVKSNRQLTDKYRWLELEDMQRVTLIKPKLARKIVALVEKQWKEKKRVA